MPEPAGDAEVFFAVEGGMELEVMGCFPCLSLIH